MIRPLTGAIRLAAGTAGPLPSAAADRLPGRCPGGFARTHPVRFPGGLLMAHRSPLLRVTARISILFSILLGLRVSESPAQLPAEAGQLCQ